MRPEITILVILEKSAVEQSIVILIYFHTFLTNFVNYDYHQLPLIVDSLRVASIIVVPDRWQWWQKQRLWP